MLRGPGSKLLLCRVRHTQCDWLATSALDTGSLPPPPADFDENQLLHKLHSLLDHVCELPAGSYLLRRPMPPKFSAWRAGAAEATSVVDGLLGARPALGGTAAGTTAAARAAARDVYDLKAELSAPCVTHRAMDFIHAHWTQGGEAPPGHALPPAPRIPNTYPPQPAAVLAAKAAAPAAAAAAAAAVASAATVATATTVVATGAMWRDATGASRGAIGRGGRAPSGRGRGGGRGAQGANPAQSAAPAHAPSSGPRWCEKTRQYLKPRGKVPKGKAWCGQSGKWVAV